MADKYAQLVELLDKHGVLQFDGEWAEPIIAFVEKNKPRKRNTRAQLPSQGGEPAEGERPGYDALWLWFSLSRSSYAVLPRVMMHDMPDAWQAEFARLMDQWDETWINQPDFGTRVQLVDADGRIVKTPDWLLNYRHPNREQLASMRQRLAKP